jgi:hypothetical protein
LGQDFALKAKITMTKKNFSANTGDLTMTKKTLRIFFDPGVLEGLEGFGPEPLIKSKQVPLFPL